MIRRIQIFSTIEEVSRRAADIFATEAAAAAHPFSVALSGGTTPGPLYSILAEEYASRIDWRRINFFWADERCVPKDHPSSNFKLAYDLLLSRLPVPESNIHRIHGELTSDRAAMTYEKELSSFFRESPLPKFDFIFLGVGTDGHTASIFPGEKEMTDSCRTAIAVHVTRLNSDRVSLSLAVLNNAATVVFVVTGEDKAEIVRDIVEGKIPCPAARVNPPMGTTTWLLDSKAVSLLQNCRSTTYEF